MKRERRYYLFTALLSKIINLGRGLPDNYRGSILVLKYDELGDLITAIPALRTIRERFPDSRISLLVKPYLKRLLLHMNLADDYPSANEIGALKPGVVFDLRSNWNILKSILPSLPARFYSRGQIRLSKKLSKNAHPHEVQANLDILRLAGIEENPPEVIGF